MKYLLILFSLTLPLSITAQLSIDTTSIFIYDSTTNSSYDLSRYFGISAIDAGHTEWFNRAEEFDDTVSESKFLIDTITESEFEKFKKKYKPKLNTDSSKVKWTDSSIVITTEQSEKIFNTIITDDFPYNYYLGFLQPLNLYVTWWIDGHNEIGSMMLLDNISGKSYELSSPFDEPNQTILLSPKEKYVITYANTYYETDHCFISVIKINKSKKFFKPVFKYGLYIDKVNIEEMVWINDNSFALKVTEAIENSNDNDLKNRRYLTVAFNKKNESSDRQKFLKNFYKYFN